MVYDFTKYIHVQYCMKLYACVSVNLCARICPFIYVCLPMMWRYCDLGTNCVCCGGRHFLLWQDTFIVSGKEGTVWTLEDWVSACLSYTWILEGGEDSAWVLRWVCVYAIYQHIHFELLLCIDWWLWESENVACCHVCNVIYFQYVSFMIKFGSLSKGA